MVIEGRRRGRVVGLKNKAYCVMSQNGVWVELFSVAYANTVGAAVEGEELYVEEEPYGEGPLSKNVATIWIPDAGS